MVEESDHDDDKEEEEEDDVDEMKVARHGVDSGPSGGQAASTLSGLFAKKRAKPASSGKKSASSRPSRKESASSAKISASSRSRHAAAVVPVVERVRPLKNCRFSQCAAATAATDADFKFDGLCCGKRISSKE